jgi:hypothetical protein
MKRPRLAVALVLLLIGLVWIGQGVGLLGGSPMSSQTIWALIGSILVLVAAGVAWTARPGTRR